jgi:hypothetical protein
MATAQQQRTAIDARRFAGVFAGFDVGNGSEEEALSKGRLLRRMAAQANLRIVDVLELPEVRQAIDAQLQPVRNGAADLQTALEQAAALREELTDRMRDVRKLAELLARQKLETEGLRRQVAAGAGRRVAATMSQSAATRPSLGTQSWFFEAAAAVMVAILLVMAVLTGRFSERSNAHELGNNKGNSPALVRKGGSVLSLPKPRAVPHRLHRGGAPVGTR